MYPISNPSWWNWQQSPTLAAGPARAEAMMEAALAADQDWYGQVAGYHYVDSSGTTVTTAVSMPIVIGETGWKAVQTNWASEIEYWAALQVNAKWYLDLLYGNLSQGYDPWEGSAGGPVSIFWFEAMDEQWEGIDDGWGLGDEDRNARYALCGTSAGPACNADLYAGAGDATALLLALVPLLVAGPLPGLEIEHPMAVVIMGGLITSTTLNLFIVPVLYLRFARPYVPGTSRATA